MRFVLVPGIGSSDDRHWQSVWQTRWGDDASRIAPSSWTEPDLDDWCEATVNVGALGHIGSESEVGEWIQGQTLLSVFLAMATR